MLYKIILSIMIRKMMVHLTLSQCCFYHMRITWALGNNTLICSRSHPCNSPTVWANGICGSGFDNIFHRTGQTDGRTDGRYSDDGSRSSIQVILEQMLFTWSNCISFNQFCGLSDAMRMWQRLDGGCDSEAEGDDDCLSGIIYLLSANWIDESLISFYTLPVAEWYWPFGIWSVNNNINNTGENANKQHYLFITVFLTSALCKLKWSNLYVTLLIHFANRWYQFIQFMT